MHELSKQIDHKDMKFSENIISNEESNSCKDRVSLCEVIKDYITDGKTKHYLD